MLATVTVRTTTVRATLVAATAMLPVMTGHCLYIGLLFF
jgi:hypothetical protein